MRYHVNRFFATALFSLGLLMGTTARASHIVGLDLYYTYVSGNTYTVTLIAYGDCGPASATAFATLPTCSPQICIWDGTTYVDTLALLIQAPDSGVEITPVCPADIHLTQCTNNTYAIPGIKKFVYTAQYTLPYTSAAWCFTFTGLMGGGNLAGRAAAITNISSGTIIQLTDTLNNTVYHNSNAVMTTEPTPFFCVNNSDSYNPGAVDPDGDSLAFSLISGINGAGNCSGSATPVSYLAPYSGSAPLDVTPGSFNFDQHTGQISFVPDILQRALVVYNCEEYRHGVFVGSCQREMTFLVITCTDIPPSGNYSNASAGTIADSTHFYICYDSGAYTLHINPTESDTTNQITVTASGIPPGAAFYVIDDSTNHPQCSFSWTTTGVAPGTYIYYITFQDNACPVSGTQTTAFTISVKPAPEIVTTGAATNCFQPAGTLTASGGISYAWSPASGLSCATCDTTISTAHSTTVYTVTVTDGLGCKGSDTASIQVNQVSSIHFLHNVTTSARIDYGSQVQLNADGAVIYYWKPDDGTLNNPNINDPVASPVRNTVYIVYGYNMEGCLDTALVTIDVATTTETIPDAFTPNNDGHNDVFRIVNLQDGKLVEMRIFNRWGQLVCKTSDNETGWDGKYDGVPQDMGVYNYYILVAREDGKTVAFKGDLTLIR